MVEENAGGEEKVIRRIWHRYNPRAKTKIMMMKLTSSTRRILRPLPPVLLWGWVGFLTVVLLSLLLAAPPLVGGTEDWTLQCPLGCKCTWVSGKKTADCRGSQWTRIPSGLSSEVQVIEMGGVSLKVLPKEAFKSVGLVNLQKVFLQNCRIERIDPQAFQDLEIMIELDLSGNLISSLDMESFETNVRLRELKVGRNPLTRLQGTSFPPLMYLKLLDFSDCGLSNLPSKAFDKLKVLETLSLSGNKFTYLPKEILKPLVKLKSLSLSGNPWRCDCRLKSLRDWVIEKNLFQRHTKCADPPHVSTFFWDQLRSPDFACRPEIVSVQINGKPTDALLVHTDIGSDITLQCLVRGNPLPELKWVRDGTVLTNRSRAQGKSYYLHIGEEIGEDVEDYRGRWVNLTIPRTDAEDAGEYTCSAVNSGGVVEKNLTLNFQDVPSGAGVGHGLGGLAGGAYRDSEWIWIVITCVAVLMVSGVLIFTVCVCTRKKRGIIKTNKGGRGQDVKGEGQDDQTAQRQLLLTSSSHSQDKSMMDEEMLLMKEKYLVGPDSSKSKSTDDMLRNGGGGVGVNGSLQRPSSAQGVLMMINNPPRPPSSALLSHPHHNNNHHNQSSEYPPDLLDLPNARFQTSPAPSTTSTLADSTRLLITPQPAIVVNPSRLYSQNPHAIYSSVPTTPTIYSPQGGPGGGGFSPTEAVIIPQVRQGYVTLPRRHRVPSSNSSWSPAGTLNRAGGDIHPSLICPPSPTGSAATVSFPLGVGRPGYPPRYDNMGPRTTADGSSRLSLNALPNENGSSSTPQHNLHGLPPPPPVGGLMTGTLGRHNILRSTPHHQPMMRQFPPIQEVDQVTVPPGEEDAPLTKTEPSSSPLKKKAPPKPPPKPMKKKGSDEQQNQNQESEDTKDELKKSFSAAEVNDDGTEV